MRILAELIKVLLSILPYLMGYMARGKSSDKANKVKSRTLFDDEFRQRVRDKFRR